MTLTFCSAVLFLFTKFTTIKETKVMPVQNQDPKKCGVCDWKLIIKNTAVQVRGWLLRGGGNPMWESLLMKQIMWYKKLNSPSPLSPLIHRWWCSCVRWVEITPRCRKNPPTGGSNAALTPTSKLIITSWQGDGLNSTCLLPEQNTQIHSDLYMWHQQGKKCAHQGWM